MELLCLLWSLNSICFRGYFGTREKRGVDISVSLIIFGVSLVVLIELGWRDIIASSPYLHLLFAMFLNSLQFIQTLQCTIVSLIESPISNDGDVVAIDLISSIIIGLYGPCEYWSIGDIELIPILMECLPCFDSFLDACIWVVLPADDRRTSVHPVKRFSLFHKL